jgi:hypothetical protein
MAYLDQLFVEKKKSLSLEFYSFKMELYFRIYQMYKDIFVDVKLEQPLTPAGERRKVAKTQA